MQNAADSYFLGVIVQLHSKYNLDSLVNAFRCHTKSMFTNQSDDGINTLSFQYSPERRRCHRPDSDIRNLLSIIEKIGPCESRAWRQSSSRTFDIGFQAVTTPNTQDPIHVTSKKLATPGSLLRLARLKINIVSTIYPADPSA